MTMCTFSAFYFNAGEQPALTRQGEAGRDQLTFFPALCEHLHSEEFLEVCVERKIVLQELVRGEKVQAEAAQLVCLAHLVRALSRLKIQPLPCSPVPK